MRAEAAIYALMNSSSGLAALVGTRIYLDTRPEADALPAVVFVLVSEKVDSLHPSGEELVTSRIQVNAFGAVAEDAVNVREQIRLACHNKSGQFGGVDVAACYQDSSGPDSYDELVNIYMKPMDFMVRFTR